MRKYGIDKKQFEKI